MNHLIKNLKFKIKNLLLLLSALLVAGAGIFIYSYFFSKPASAAWFNESWLYRKALTVTVSSSASDISSLETLVTVDTSASGKFQASCQDLRFTNQKGELLPYYIDSGCGTDSTKVWVLADLVPKNTTTYMMYMYYGNPSAPAGTDTNTFKLFQGLVNYWTMNESSWNGTSGEVKDNSVNANNGTGTGSATTAAGKYGNAASLNGSSAYVDLGEPNSLKFTNADSFTISGWVNVTGAGGGAAATNHMVNIAYACTSGIINIVTDPNNAPAFNIRDAADASSGVSALTTISTGQWYHLTAVRDTATDKLYIYVNGVLENSASDTTNGNLYSVSVANYIGKRYPCANPGYFNGSIDDVRIYNRALSAAEISQLYTNPGNIASNVNATVKPTTVAGSEEQSPGPVGYWAFDDGQGQTAQDSSSSNNDGTITGATWQPEDRCIAGKCLYFDGTDDVVSMGDVLDYSGTGWTVSAWVKLNDTSSSHTIISKRDTDQRSFDLYYESSDQKFYYQVTNSASSTDAYRPSSVTASAGQWYLVTGVYSPSSQLDVYVNGVLSNGTLGGTIPSTIRNSTAPLRIGMLENTYYMKGFIDEPKIYPYARIAAQIKADYNSGKANAGTNSGAGAVLGAQPQDYLSNGLVGYWKMDEASGTRADSSGNGNTLTDNNTVTSNPGKFGNAGQFTRATSEYLNITDNTNVSVGDIDFTFAAWVYMDSKVQDQMAIIGKDDGSGNREYSLSYLNTDDRFRFTINGAATTIANSLGSPSAGTWYFIVAWHDAASNTANIQINNGSVDSAATGGTAPTDGASNFNIGQLGNDARMWDGRIDEVRFYKRALSPKERSDLYNWAPGPVGYWDFEEGSGTNVADKSGNGSNGTWNGTGAKHWDIGKYGKAGRFDGSSDYVNVDSSSNWAFGANDFSINFWIKPDTSQDGPIMGRRWTNRSWMLYLQSGVLYLTASSDGTNWTAPLNASSGVGITLTNNIWQHVAFLRNGSNWYGYLNGAQQDTASSSMTIYSGSEPLHIGADSEGASWYYSKGMLDDIRIYNYARSVKQVISDMNAGHPNVGSPVGSAVGHWDFDEGQGTVANNSGSGGSTYNGTITNATWSQAGKFNRALNFTASNSEYVSVTSPVNTTANTVSAWFKVTTNAANQGVLSAGNSIADGLPYLLLQNNSGTLRIYNADFDYATVSSISTATWYFVTIVNAGTNQKVYLNGIQKLNRTIGGGNNTNFYIGAGYNATFDGVIDEVKVYNYALTADEVKLDYNRGSSMVLGTLGNLSTLSNSAAGQEYCIPGDSSTCTAPVARWDFEERADNTCSGGTNDVCDTSGSGNDGAWNGTGAKHWATGKVGSAGKFNGTDDYVSIGTGNILPTGTNPFTVSSWVYSKNALSSGQQIVYLVLKQDTQFEWIVYNDSGTYRSYVGFRDPAPYTNTYLKRDTIDYPNVLKDKWAYVTLVYNGGSKSSSSSYKIYINGVELSNSTTMVSGGGTGSDNIIGANTGGADSWLNGQIDQVRIFNYARSAAQIAYDYNKGAPVGYWDFDECQGATAYDQSGNNNHGTITIGATDEATLGTCTTSSTAWGSGATGKRNASLSFDGTDDYVSVTNGSNFNFGNNDFTLAAWVYYATTPGSTNREYIIAHTGADDGGYALATDDLAGGIRFWGNDGSWKNAQATGLVANTWYHFVAVHDGSLNIYVNGVLKQTTAVGTLTNPLTSDFLIGKATNMNYATKYHNGQIDDVRVYNYALTAAQVKDEYNGGAVRFGPSTGSP